MRERKCRVRRRRGKTGGVLSMDEKPHKDVPGLSLAFEADTTGRTVEG